MAQPRGLIRRRTSGGGGRRRWRLLQCFDDKPGACNAGEPVPLAARVAGRKRGDAPKQERRYAKLAAEAERSVPKSVAKQIRMDVQRSFTSLPQTRAGVWGWPTLGDDTAKEERLEVLFRILITSEWRAMRRFEQGVEQQEASAAAQEDQHEVAAASSSATAAADPAGEQKHAGYVQGWSLLAAMCLGFCGGQEEEAYWMLAHLLEDVLGVDYFARSPPLLGYHGDCAAAFVLVADEAPQLTRALGRRRLKEFTSTLASRCLLSGFVGFLADGPLIAFWRQLLEGDTRCAAFPRFPLLACLVGLVRFLDRDLALVAAEARPEELVPLMFKKAQEVAKDLPEDWSPAMEDCSEPRLREIRAISQDAAQAHLRSYKERQSREMHAQMVWQSLDRTMSQLQDAMQSAELLVEGAATPGGARRPGPMAAS